jgi:putative tryptophan/tyrosine transport system substrate-binding protein
LADELVRLKADVIVAGGPNDALTARNATKTIPVVFTDTPFDPVARGLVDSLSRPRGNVTGFYSMADILAGKRVHVLKESIPKLSHVAVLWNPRSDSQDDSPQLKESQLAVQELGFQLHSMKVSNTDQYETAFKEAMKARVTAVAVTRHRLFTNYQEPIITLAAKYRVPAIHYREDFVESGGLMSYGADEIEPFSGWQQ